jgi:orotate phosphoribosyltransferase-like protein
MQDTSALQRSLDYKPGDPFLQQALADTYMQNAEELIQPCLESYSRGPSKNKVEDCNSIINTTEQWLLKSQSLYQNVLNSNSPQKTTTKINLSNLSQNLKTLDQMKQFKS